MAEVQTSGPLPGQKFAVGLWSTHFGFEPGIRGDTDGSAFSLTLPSGSDVAEVGSATVKSVAKINGFPLEIAAGSTQSITIPASSGGGANGRTDLIVVRFDSAAYATSPGPVRLARIAGTEGSLDLPAYNPATELRLWAVRRRQGEGLNQAIPTDLRTWTGPHLLLAPNATLPTSAPLGMRVTRGGTTYRRDKVGSSVQWVEEISALVELSGTAAVQAVDGSGWGRNSACRLVRDGKRRWMNLVMSRGGGTDGGNITSNANSGGIGDLLMAKLDDADKPGVELAMDGRCKDTSGATYDATGHITTAGNLYLSALSPGVTIGPSGPSDTVTFTVSWYVP